MHQALAEVASVKNSIKKSDEMLDITLHIFPGVKFIRAKRIYISLNLLRETSSSSALTNIINCNTNEKRFF